MATIKKTATRKTATRTNATTKTSTRGGGSKLKGLPSRPNLKDGTGRTRDQRLAETQKNMNRYDNTIGHRKRRDAFGRFISDDDIFMPTSRYKKY